MKTFVVLYRRNDIMSPLEAPFGFTCEAEDLDHAEEQLVNAEPDGDIVWVFEGSSYREALDDYWSAGLLLGEPNNE